MKTVIWFVIVLLPFFNFFVAPNISFADIGLIIGSLCLFLFKNKSFFFSKEIKSDYLIYFLVWAILSSFFLLLNPENSHIDSFGLIKNILRFLVVVYFFLNLKFIFRNFYLFNYLFKTWEKVIYFVCLLAFFEYFLQFFGIYYSYYFEGITTTTGRTPNKFFRISSIFNEPSYLVIYLNLSLLVITEYYSQYKFSSKLNYKRLLFTIVLTILLAKSIVGYLLLIFILISYKGIIFENRVKGNSVIYFFIFSVFFGLIFFFNNKRIQNIYDLEDGSANHRLLGSFELGKVIIENDYYFTGVGIGQHKLFLEEKTFSLEDHFFMKGESRNSGINNMFILVYFQLGIVGLFLYLYFLYNSFRSRKIIFLFFLISGFGWAFTFNPLYWFCISILHIIINGRKKNLIYIN